MRLIDADLIGLTDFEIITCDGNYKMALEILLKKIEEAPVINQWIPCSERLPELVEYVLVTDGDNIHKAYLRDCYSFATDDIYEWVDDYDYLHDFDEWSAWMPLPEPYKGDEE